jgi:hypothetical protein
LTESQIDYKPRRTPSGILLHAAVILLVTIALIDASDMMLHLKLPAFAAVFLVWFYRQLNLNRRMDRERSQSMPWHVWITVLTVAGAIPLLWVLTGLLKSDLHSGEAPFGLVKTFLFFSIVLVAISEKINLINYINRLSVILALVTIAMFVISLASPDVSLIISGYVAGKGNGLVAANRTLFGVETGEFYYSACPIMIFPFTFYLNRWTQNGGRKFASVFLCLLFGTALLLTGARAEILTTLGLVVLFLLRQTRRRLGWGPALIASVLVTLFAAATVIPSFTDTKEVSNAVKLKHIHSYYEEFSHKPGILFSGEGANSAFYSEGFEAWSTITEVTYLELVRVFGLPMMLMFFAGMLWIVYSLFANGFQATGLAFLGFLGIAASNPLLVGSTGFLVLAAVYEQALSKGEGFVPSPNQFRLWGNAIANRG